VPDILPLEVWYHSGVLVPDVDSEPNRPRPRLPHGFVFVLIFSILACIAAGAIALVGLEAWTSKGISKEGKTIAIFGGAAIGGISALLLTTAFVLVMIANPRLRLWQCLMLLVPPALAALMSGFTLLAVAL
jgi:hypothetical protein